MKNKRTVRRLPARPGRNAVEPAAKTEPVETGGGPRLVVNESRHEPVRSRLSRGRLGGDGVAACADCAESQEQKTPTMHRHSGLRISSGRRTQVWADSRRSGSNTGAAVLRFRDDSDGCGSPGRAASAGGYSGARNTIDLLGRFGGEDERKLTDAEDGMLQSVLFEARMAFMELTRMITLQGMQPPAGRRRERGRTVVSGQ